MLTLVHAAFRAFLVFLLAGYLCFAKDKPDQNGADLLAHASALQLFQHASTAQRMAACERWPALLAKKVAPQYPPAVRRAQEQGTVMLYVLLSGQGTVDKTSVLQSAGNNLDQSASEAVRQWVYSPLSCAPVSLRTEIEVQVNYELRAE